PGARGPDGRRRRRAGAARGDHDSRADLGPDLPGVASRQGRRRAMSGPRPRVEPAAGAPAGASAIEHCGFFAMRTPLLPFSELLRWSEGVAAPGAVGGADGLAAAWAADCARLRERLRRVVSRPEVREA